MIGRILTTVTKLKMSKLAFGENTEDGKVESKRHHPASGGVPKRKEHAPAPFFGVSKLN
jgi:hypothetical protein